MLQCSSVHLTVSYFASCPTQDPGKGCVLFNASSALGIGLHKRGEFTFILVFLFSYFSILLLFEPLH